MSPMPEPARATGIPGSSAQGKAFPANTDPERRERHPVVLDTNALLLPFTSGVRLHEELERLLGPTDWIVPSSVKWELERLGKGRDATARAARMAVKLTEQAAHVETSLPGDDGVLEVAGRHQAVVATNDRTLQAEAVRRGLRVVVARTGGRLAFLGAGSGGGRPT